MSRFAATADAIDLWLEFAKPLVAIASILVLPTTFVACVQVLPLLVPPSTELVLFVVGCACYLFAEYWVTRARVFGTFFSTLEHELTHALIAKLTFHRVLSIRSTWRDGGHIRFVGRGNWLIALAPYFLPTFSLFLVPVVLLFPGLLGAASHVVLGMTWAYHTRSTIRETHWGQTDLKKAGWVFSIMFLPAANLWTMMGLVALVAGGWEGMTDFFSTASGWRWLVRTGG